MVQNQIKRKTPVYGLIGILTAIIIVAMIYSYGIPQQISPTPSPMANPSPSTNNLPLPTANPDVPSIQTFETYNDLESFLENNSGLNVYWTGTSGVTGQPLPGVVPSNIPAPTPAPSVSVTGQDTTSDKTGNSFSQTNIQVAGVDEADSVKTDGNYLYVIANNTVYILNAGSSNPEDAKVLSKIDINNTFLSGIYLSQDGNKLAVLGNQYTAYISDGASSFIMPPNWRGSTTFVKVYDVSNKASPTLVRNFTMSGNYFNSRMIGDYIYDIVTESVNVGANGTFNVPIVFSGDKVSSVAPSDIFYIPSPSNYYTYTTVVSANIMDSSLNPTNITVMMGGTSEMYVSTDNIYITTPTWFGQDQNTNIYRISISQAKMSLEAKGAVFGSPINQYAMDEYNGYFRIATTTWIQDNATTSDGAVFKVNRQVNSIYVMNSDLKVVGKLERFKMDENLYAVRFMGDRCYVVTAKQTDPFFIIDMSNPTAPKVAGQLKIPGYSSYLYPMDENHVIGLGKENNTVKLSLFDVSNVNAPTEIAKYVVNASYSDSNALYDPHAFLFDSQKQMLVIPVSINDVPVIMPLRPTTNQGPETTTTSKLNYWQGVYIFSVSPSNGFILEGNITQIDHAETLNSSTYWTTSSLWINRSLDIDNTLYTFSNSRVQLNSLTDFALLSRIDLG